MRRSIAALAALLLLPSSSLAASAVSPATVDQYFRVQWEAGPSVLTGHVENVSNLPVDRMELLVERLDATGAVVGSQRAWVMGVVVPNNRTFFSTAVAAAASYRVTVRSFDWTTCRD